MSEDKLTKEQTKAYDKMAVAIGEFLKLQGWKVALVSGARIEHPIGNPKLKYQFSVDFLGSKTEEKNAAS